MDGATRAGQRNADWHGVVCNVMASNKTVSKCVGLFFSLSLSWRDRPLVGLGLLLIHEDFCGF